MTEERKPDGWFIALKDAKTGKVNELSIMRTPEAADEWRSKGYIVRPFIYLNDEDEKPRTCENCKYGFEPTKPYEEIDYRVFEGIPAHRKYLECQLIEPFRPKLSRPDRPWVPLHHDVCVSSFEPLNVPKDHYCKHWEKKDESVDSR